MGFGNLGIAAAKKAAEATKKAAKATKAIKPKRNWKKILEAGAIATDALSKGSAGGIGKALVDAKIDLSGNAFDEQNTEDAAGNANYKDAPTFQNRVKGK
tara:strand:+ start:1611 stop:1910 length:300 start_codon:yes stop_codon:yes gene_type:complete